MLPGAQRLIAAGQVAVVAFILSSCVLFGLVYVARFLDDTAYHIPAAVRIAQHLNPYFVDSPVDSHWFPAAAETVVALLIVPTGSLNVTNLSGGLCCIALVLLMYRFAGLWCRAPGGRLATVGCVSTVPLLIGQSLAFYVDVHVALLVCLSLYFQCRSLLTRRARDAYCGLAAAALLPGVKYSGIVLFAMLALGCAVCVWRAAPPRRPPAAVLALVLAAGLFSSGWYVRNWLVRGNPVFPFELPPWLEPLRRLSGTAYEFDSEHGIAGPLATWPHPWVPRSWIAHRYTPHMTDDGFGAGGVLAGLCTLLSLLVLRRYPPLARQAWIVLLLVTAALAVAFPYGLQIPRYVLFLPIIAALGPAVLCGAARSRREHAAAIALCAGVLVFSAAYAGVNLLWSGPAPQNVRQALTHLVPYNPERISDYAYVHRGHLRIGYTSGFYNVIATLYDERLTNTLIPLHYRNYPFNAFREMSSADEFVRYVASLRLDYIHVFDPHYPGVDLLRQHFPDKIMPPELRPR